MGNKYMKFEYKVVLIFDNSPEMSNIEYQHAFKLAAREARKIPADLVIMKVANQDIVEVGNYPYDDIPLTIPDNVEGFGKRIPFETVVSYVNSMNAMYAIVASDFAFKIPQVHFKCPVTLITTRNLHSQWLSRFNVERPRFISK